MSRHYDSASRLLHWLSAVLIVSVFAAALIQEEMPRGDARTLVLALHIFVGSGFLVLVILRGGWALLRPKPVEIPMPGWMSASSRIVHASLYALMLAVPLAGIWLYGVRGRPSALLNVTMPSLFQKNDAMRGIAGEIHELLAYALIAFALLHIGAALYHHFILKDGILERMRGARDKS